jgi:hypothetical protein
MFFLKDTFYFRAPELRDGTMPDNSKAGWAIPVYWA